MIEYRTGYVPARRAQLLALKAQAPIVSAADNDPSKRPLTEEEQLQAMEEQYTASLQRERRADGVPTDEELAQKRLRRRQPDTTAKEEQEASFMLLSKKKRKMWVGYQKAKSREANRTRRLREKRAYLDSKPAE